MGLTEVNCNTCLLPTIFLILFRITTFNLHLVLQVSHFQLAMVCGEIGIPHVIQTKDLFVTCAYETYYKKFLSISPVPPQLDLIRGSLILVHGNVTWVWSLLSTSYDMQNDLTV